MATSARIGYLGAIATDTFGNLFLGDVNNFRIRKVDAVTGIITTIAGNGIAGFSGDSGLATNAQIHPVNCEIATDDTGNIYLSDGFNFRIRKISKVTGVINTISGTGVPHHSGDGGPASAASFGSVNSITVDRLNNIYVCDSGVWIRKISTAGIISIVAGNGILGNSGDNGIATSAQITCLGMACDTNNNLFFAQPPYIRKVNVSTGIISTIAGDGSVIYNNGVSALATGIGASYICFDKYNRLYLSEASMTYSRVRVINTNGIVNVVAGNGSNGFSGDNGPSYLAKLSYPYGIVADNVGDIYIADLNNLRIRKVTKPYYLAILGLDTPQLSIFPTPTTNLLHITGLKETATYTLYEMTGRAVMAGALLPKENEINISNLATGLYLLQVQYRDGKREIRKIVKE